MFDNALEKVWEETEEGLHLGRDVLQEQIPSSWGLDSKETNL